MSLIPSDRLTELRSRVEEVRERARAKIDEIRTRIGGGGSSNPGRILELPILKNLGFNKQPIRRFTAAGPRKYVSDLWFHDTHTKAAKEIKAMGPGPLQKNSVKVAEVPPKILDK